MDSPASSDRIGLADQVFSDALDLPPAERVDFVRERCALDTDLGNSILRLLSRYGRLGDFLETPAFEPRSGEFRPGEMLNSRFRIISSVGRGGMGEVYCAEDSELGESVALKTLNPRLRGEPTVEIRFREEIRLARKIAHPNVCRIFDLFAERRGSDQIVYFTMEYLEGSTLAQRLAQGRLSADETMGIARQIAAGLDAAHRIGIIHRDLKPANVMLVRQAGGSDRAVIMDFGLAKAAGAVGATSSQTQADLILGTPDYMAPEQFLGSEVTPAADVFAFGLILYEMVCGQRPFPAESAVRAAVRRLTEPPERLGNCTPVPNRWSRVIARALAMKPENRFQSAGEVTAALDGKWQGVSRRTLLYAGAASGLAAFSVAGLFGVSRFIEWRVGLPARPLLMLTPFTHSADPKDGALAAEALDLLIANQLQQSAHVRVLGKDRIQAARRLIDGSPKPDSRETDAATARHIALREGAHFLVFGSLGRVGDQRVLQIDIELMGSDSSRARRTWLRTFPAQQQSDLLSAAYDAASWLRQTAGESGGELDARSRRPEELTTSSWQALQEYMRSDSAWRANEADSAILHLKTALDLDPEFAQAAARMADILTALNRPDEGLPYHSAAAAIVRRKNLTDRESLRIAGLFALDTGQLPDAERVFARYALEYPEDGLPLFYQASAIDRQGRGEQALQLIERAIALDPQSYSFSMARADRLLDAGRVRECAAQCESAAKLKPGDWADIVRSAVAFARLDFGAVWSSLERMRSAGSLSYQSRAYGLEACLRAEQGQWADAERILRDGLAFDARMGLGAQPQFAKQRLLAQACLRRGRRAAAIGLCGEMLAARLGHEKNMQTGCLLAQAGEIEGARACLIGGLPDWPVYNHWILRLRGEIALAQGQAARALESMRSAPPSRIKNEWPEYIVRAALAAKDMATARLYIMALVENPGRFWMQADNTGPGHIAWALDEAATAGLPAHDLEVVGGLRKALVESTLNTERKTI